MRSAAIESIGYGETEIEFEIRLRDGAWHVVERVAGRIGGIFASLSDAVAFARAESSRFGGGRVVIDLQRDGRGGANIGAAKCDERRVVVPFVVAQIALALLCIARAAVDAVRHAWAVDSYVAVLLAAIFAVSAARAAKRRRRGDVTPL